MYGEEGFGINKYGYLEDIQKSIDAGMNAHIGKPIDTKELLKTLVKFIR